MKQFIMSIVAASALLLGIVHPTHADTNINSATAVSGSNADANSKSNSTALQGNVQATNFEGTHIPSSTTVKNVPAIAAPALTTTLTETCMGSTSGGVSVAGFGVTVGSTWKDEECVRRLHAREISALGEKDVAKEVLCGSPIVAEAYAAVGRPCKVGVSPNQGAGGVIGVDRGPVASPKAAAAPAPSYAAGDVCAVARANKDQFLAARNGCRM